MKVLTALGDVQVKGGLFKEALDSYRKAFRLADDGAVLKADLLLKRAKARERAGAFSIALGDITKGLRLLEDDETLAGRATRARLTALRAAVRQAQDRPRPALQLAEQAVEQASCRRRERGARPRLQHHEHRLPHARPV